MPFPFTYVIIGRSTQKPPSPAGGAQLSSPHPLRLNVGFLLHQNVGFSRVFDFDHEQVALSEDLKLKRFQGELRFTRATQGLHGQGELSAWVSLECVRCLEEYDQELNIEVNDLFASPPSEAVDPLLAIPETAILDLRPLMREFAFLATPIRPLCREDCKGLCPECGADRNQTDCGHRLQEIDPRLAAGGTGQLALEGVRDSG